MTALNKLVHIGNVHRWEMKSSSEFCVEFNKDGVYVLVMLTSRYSVHSAIIRDGKHTLDPKGKLEQIITYLGEGCDMCRLRPQYPH